MKKKLMAIMLALGAALFVGNVRGDTINLATKTSAYVAQDGDVLTGTLGDGLKLSVADGATVTLNGVTINGLDDNTVRWAGIDCLGDATIILAGGNDVTNNVAGQYAGAGIHVPPSKTLVIRGTGVLAVTGGRFAAGIGAGFNAPCGNIVIEGGVVIATGAYAGAGIGAGYSASADAEVIASCGDITISNSTVIATGSYSAGIGGGYFSPCGDILIAGDSVTATGDSGGSGIGAGNNGACGDITVSAGNVTATGAYASGIGGGNNTAPCGDIVVSGGTIVATGAIGAGIGSGNGAYALCNGTITISGGDITAVAGDGNNYGAGIGGGWNCACNDIHITGGTINATGNHGAGIGGGYQRACGNIVIEGGEITATVAKANDSTGAAGIGGGCYSSCGDITIYGGNIAITKTGAGGAGIGAGRGRSDEDTTSSCGKITIKDGAIEIVTWYGAGIGGGEVGAKCGDISIEGGRIIASSTMLGAGIGAGFSFAHCGNIVIKGGYISASGGEDAAGIGGGSWCGTSGDVTIMDGTAQLVARKGSGARHSIGEGDLIGSCGTVTIFGVEGFIAESPYAFSAAGLGNLADLVADYVAQDGTVLTGTLGGNYKISIADGATVTLSNAVINGVNSSAYPWAGLTCLGDATIILAGDPGVTNKVSAFYEYYPGIAGTVGKTITIRGSGILDVRGGSYGAGIGGGYYVSCGNIVIEDGTVIASCGYGSASIGGGVGHEYQGGGGNCGDITISGGTVMATGGIGGGYSSSACCGDIRISGGTVVASGHIDGAGIGGGHNGSCSNITITAGTVTATGATGAGIGAGESSICGDIVISGGTVKATGSGSAGIGAGYGYYYSSTGGNCGNITISGGIVEATGGPHAAGIGAGGCDQGGGGNCGDITISGGTVTASGQGDYAPGIGGSYFGSCGDITITEDVTGVTANAGEYAWSIGHTTYGYNTCGAVTIGGVVYYDGTTFHNNGASEVNGLKKKTYVYIPGAAGAIGGTVAFKSGATPAGWTVSSQGAAVTPGTTFVAAGNTVTLAYSGEKLIDSVTVVKKGATVDLSTITENYEAQDCDVLIGTLAADVKISIADGARVTLRDASINSASYNGVECIGDATIVLEGDNYISSSYERCSGVFVPTDQTLTICGDGGLYASGSSAYGAGIGGGHKGNVVIAGGNISAHGGSYGAGIGGKANTLFGNITITGGTVVAYGGGSAYGIGGGYMSSCGNIVIAASVTRVYASSGNNKAIGGFSSLTIGGTDYTADDITSNYYEYEGDGTGGGPVVPGKVAFTETVAGHEWTFAMDAFDVTVDVVWGLSGSGTPADPYLIGDYFDLVTFASRVNGGETNAWAIVTNDIVATATDWTPIACDNNSLYTGTFDGQGHAISGLSNASISPKPEVAGLFGYVLAGGKVRNVQMVNVDLACDSNGGGGGIAGYVVLGTVENCTSSGTVTGYYVGGIVGGAEATVVENCSSSCDVTGTFAGGIAGYCDEITVTNCTASCAITDSGSSTYTYGGGIVGYIYHGNITHCSAAGSVTAFAAGGILGYGESRVSVELCRSSCDVTGTYCVGGIVGYNYKGTIYNCFNTGVIVETDNNNGYESSGGVAGVSYCGTVENCHSIGAVTGANYVGGVVGANVGSDTATNKVLSCYSLDTVAAGVLVGYEEGRTECSNLLALSAAQFRDATNFVDWDFDNIWYMGANAPQLWAFASDQMFADIAAAAIDAIGEVAYTDESKAKIDAARAAYDALTAAQKALVANYATLTAAEAAYAALAPAPVEPDAPCYVVIDETDIVAPYDAPKAVTLAGVAYDGCDVIGIVELKLGKVNAKKGTSKVSGSVTTLDGKKHTAKGVTVTGIEGTSPATVSLEVKGLGTMAVTIGGDKFAGSLGAYHVQSADVGGAWAGGSAVAAVEPGDLTVLAGTVLSDFLPTNEVAEVSGGKWKFGKAASVKWAKAKGAAEKSLIVDMSKGTNLSGLKLTYTPKKGTFKGSFNVYALEGAGSATKLKKYKLNVTGVVVGGVGYGVATSKKPALSWPVTVQ